MQNKKYWEYMLVTVLTVLGILYLMSMFLGFGLTDANAYNTFALQADSRLFHSMYCFR